MLADRSRHMPPGLHVAADQRFFTEALDRAALIVHGRHSHEQQPRSDRRRRVVLSRSMTALAPHPELPNALLWNPAGATFAEACAAAGVSMRFTCRAWPTSDCRAACLCSPACRMQRRRTFLAAMAWCRARRRRSMRKSAPPWSRGALPDIPGSADQN
jgi:hypothetical protein